MTHTHVTPPAQSVQIQEKQFQVDVILSSQEVAVENRGNLGYCVVCRNCNTSQWTTVQCQPQNKLEDDKLRRPTATDEFEQEYIGREGIAKGTEGSNVIFTSLLYRTRSVKSYHFLLCFHNGYPVC